MKGTGEAVNLMNWLMKGDLWVDSCYCLPLQNREEFIRQGRHRFQAVGNQRCS